MKDRAEFWAEVDAALDARRDPAREPELAAWLRAHPEDARALRRLCAGLEALRSARAPRRRSKARARAAYAALGLVAAGLLALLFVPRGPRAPQPVLRVAVAGPELGQVEHWEVELVTESRGRRTRLRVCDGVLEEREEFRTDADAAPDSVLACEITTERLFSR